MRRVRVRDAYDATVFFSVQAQGCALRVFFIFRDNGGEEIDRCTTKNEKKEGKQVSTQYYYEHVSRLWVGGGEREGLPSWMEGERLSPPSYNTRT